MSNQFGGTDTPGPLRRVMRLLIRFFVGERAEDSASYYVTSKAWPGGSHETDLDTNAIKSELDRTFDNYFESAVRSLAGVIPEDEARAGQTRTQGA